MTELMQISRCFGNWSATSQVSRFGRSHSHKPSQARSHTSPIPVVSARSGLWEPHGICTRRLLLGRRTDIRKLEVLAS